MAVLPLARLLGDRDACLTVPTSCRGNNIILWNLCSYLITWILLVVEDTLVRTTRSPTQGVLSCCTPTASAHPRDPSTPLPASAAACGRKNPRYPAHASRVRCRSRDLASLSHSEVPSQRHCSCNTHAAQPSNFAPTQETIPIGSPKARDCTH